MSQASDLVGEVKQALADITKDLKGFEGEFGELGAFTDLAHLNKAKIHLGELRAQLANRRDNAETAELAAMEAEEAAGAAPVPPPASGPGAPEGSPLAGVAPLTDADVAPEATPAPGPEVVLPEPAAGPGE